MTQALPVARPEVVDAEPTVRALTLQPFALFFTCLLLVVSSVAWRKGSFYSGGLDVVVVAKAALTVLAVVIALMMKRTRGSWAGMRAAPVLWLGGYLLVAVIGGIINAEALPSIVLAGRVGLLAFALVLITVSHPWQTVISALSSAMLVLALFGSLTGLGSLAETGRLYGGIPPLNANEICLLVSVPVLVLFWKAVHGQASRVEFYALIPLLGMIWLTGARTGLAGLMLMMVLLLADGLADTHASRRGHLRDGAGAALRQLPDALCRCFRGTGRPCERHDPQLAHRRLASRLPVRRHAC